MCRGTLNDEEAERWQAPPNDMASFVVREIVCKAGLYSLRLMVTSS